ncbi:hypothetical protein CGMCC3_g17400 [Colletotrichum fructicola]|uniref:Uncharacterized protein n=1 Tax=Colletotrichum fructicola (strain Nara gc5) TaxID=1213859 RepID=A0A7J6ID01_COLFN|nr:uncharacterized protein CGMCC3_g17400 [Colletotrichum fructicola]KAE9566440.1 hypothetical protein CGMCC3_g17400 [Colletotrichum fructicola]KAF4473627.1 hypothetical protein CGGC5_v017375 [Colletotrichum fructicola Nara gc5]
MPSWLLPPFLPKTPDSPPKDPTPPKFEFVSFRGDPCLPEVQHLRGETQRLFGCPNWRISLETVYQLLDDTPTQPKSSLKRSACKANLDDTPGHPKSILKQPSKVYFLVPTTPSQKSSLKRSPSEANLDDKPLLCKSLASDLLSIEHRSLPRTALGPPLA